MKRLGRGLRWLLYAAGLALGLLATIVIVFELLVETVRADLER